MAFNLIFLYIMRNVTINVFNLFRTNGEINLS